MPKSAIPQHVGGTLNKLFAIYLCVSIGVIYTLSYELNKARVCNKVFVKYLSLYGINVDLNKMYEDGKTWVDDPRYNSFPNKRSQHE